MLTMDGVYHLVSVTIVTILLWKQVLSQTSGAASPTGRSVFVTINGVDRAHCGQTADTPCQSLVQAAQEASAGDTILIDARHTDKQPYAFCTAAEIFLDRSVNVIGHHGTPRIGCERNSNRLQMLNITSLSTEYVNIMFQNIYMTSTVFHVNNADITFDNCIMEDTKWVSPATSPYTGMNMSNSEWRGSMDSNCTHNCKASGIIDCKGQQLSISYHDSSFYHTKLQITTMQHGEFIIGRCLFDNYKDMRVVHGGIYLTIMNSTIPSYVEVTDSVFQNQVNYDPVESIMNLYVAAFLVRSVHPNKLPLSEIVVVVENSQFVNNERGLTFIGSFVYVNVTSCLFMDNIAMHAGAAILYLTHATSPSYVTNCTFHKNAAGSYRKELIADYANSFQVSGDEVRISSKSSNGVISFIGKGGAIRIQRGNLSLIDCTFDNNSARLLGGAIFVDRDTSMYVIGTTFLTSPNDVHAMQGDIFYSNGIVTIKSAKMYVRTAENHVAVVRHSGDHWSIEVSEVSIQCPQGYRLRVTNTSAYGVTPVGLRRSYKLDQLSYFCESCARHKYSLDYGYLNYSLTYSEFAYYTMLINGDMPQAAYSGTYQYHDIKCMQCPYGGKCQQGITAVANFWGYTQDNQITFQHCPKGYCCSSTDCNRYNTCARHRTGRLCGACIPGYSEALFSSSCVPNSDCDSTYLWPLAVLSGFIYALFLLFQKDMRDFMFLKTVSLSELNCACGSRRRSTTYVANDTTLVPGQYIANHNAQLTCSTELESLHPDHDTDVDDGGINNNLKRDSEREAANGDAIHDDEEDAPPPADTGASFLIILFYYFQDAQLLHIKTVFASAENQTRAKIKEILSGLFKFRVELFQFMDQYCFLKAISPSTKLLIKVILVPYVLLIFGLMYLVYQWLIKLRGRTSSTNSNSSEAKPFLGKIATGFVLALLFTYQKLATTSFKLLNCVPVGDDNVLFIEGPIVCYQYWQYGVMAYTASCIVPFCLVLLIGPGLLKDGLISLLQFFCACIFPLPFLIYWVILRLRLNGKRPTNPVKMSDEAQAVCGILQGPFRDSDSRLFGPLCGAGVLIGRRLLLVILFTFVNDTLIRMLCMLLVCFVTLLHHVHVLPYKDTRGNLAGTASVASLLIVGAINLVRAGFEAAEYIPQGPNEFLMLVFEEIENVLMLYFPACVMGCIILALTIKVTLIILKKIMVDPIQPGSDSQTTELAPL